MEKIIFCVELLMHVDAHITLPVSIGFGYVFPWLLVYLRLKDIFCSEEYDQNF